MDIVQVKDDALTESMYTDFDEVKRNQINSTLHSYDVLVICFITSSI
jgi:hypothetical protein